MTTRTALAAPTATSSVEYLERWLSAYHATIRDLPVMARATCWHLSAERVLFHLRAAVRNHPDWTYHTFVVQRSLEGAISDMEWLQEIVADMRKQEQ